MPYLPIYMAPVTTPGRMTLQAGRVTWERMLDLIPAASRSVRSAQDGGLGSARQAIMAALDGSPIDATAIRVTMSDSDARRVLQLAGVSS